MTVTTQTTTAGYLRRKSVQRSGCATVAALDSVAMEVMVDTIAVYDYLTLT